MDNITNSAKNSFHKELEESRLECQRLYEELAALMTKQSQKMALVNNLQDGLKKLEKKNNTDEIKKGIGQLIRMIDLDASMENNWTHVSLYFNHANQHFLKRLSHEFPHLTPKDHKLCVYLRMNLSTKDIAPLLNISVRGVEIGRYRLRKKLTLENGQSLVGFLKKI